jgi:hypothetical protein
VNLPSRHGAITKFEDFIAFCSGEVPETFNVTTLFPGNFSVIAHLYGIDASSWKSGADICPGDVRGIWRSFLYFEQLSVFRVGPLLQLQGRRKGSIAEPLAQCMNCPCGEHFSDFGPGFFVFFGLEEARDFLLAP